MTRIQRPRRLIISIAIGVIGIFLSVLLHAHYERWRAEQLLITVQRIEVGTMHRGDVLRLTAPFRSHTDVMAQDQLEFVFYNRWIHKLKLAPHSEFRIWITFNKDGVVVEKKAWELVSDSGCTAAVSEVLRGYDVSEGAPIPPNHQVFWSDRFEDRLRRLRVQDDNTLPESQRVSDWKFSLNCMTRIGSGCRDARTMLPDVVVPSALSGSS
jgi:hypothetical protein